MMQISARYRKRFVELADKAAVTAAEGAILAVGAESTSANALTLDWALIGGMALGGAFLSVLINVARGGLSGQIDLRNIDAE